MADSTFAVLPLPLHLRQCGQDEKERDERMQCKQHQCQGAGSEEFYRRTPDVNGQIQRAARGTFAGPLEVISKVRILEASQALQTVGGANDLLCHIAGEPVSGQALKCRRERLDELAQSQCCRSQPNPDQQGKQGRCGIQVLEQTQVKRGAVDHHPCQRELERNQKRLQQHQHDESNQETGTGAPYKTYGQPEDARSLLDTLPGRLGFSRVRHLGRSRGRTNGSACWVRRQGIQAQLWRCDSGCWLSWDGVSESSIGCRGRHFHRVASRRGRTCCRVRGRLRRGRLARRPARRCG